MLQIGDNLYKVTFRDYFSDNPKVEISTVKIASMKLFQDVNPENENIEFPFLEEQIGGLSGGYVKVVYTKFNNVINYYNNYNRKWYNKEDRFDRRESFFLSLEDANKFITDYKNYKVSDYNTKIAEIEKKKAHYENIPITNLV